MTYSNRRSARRFRHALRKLTPQRCPATRDRLPPPPAPGARPPGAWRARRQRYGRGSDRRRHAGLERGPGVRRVVANADAACSGAASGRRTGMQRQPWHPSPDRHPRAIHSLDLRQRDQQPPLPGGGIAVDRFANSGSTQADLPPGRVQLFGSGIEELLRSGADPRRWSHRRRCEVSDDRPQRRRLCPGDGLRRLVPGVVAGDRTRDHGERDNRRRDGGTAVPFDVARPWRPCLPRRRALQQRLQLRLERCRVDSRGTDDGGRFAVGATRRW